MLRIFVTGDQHIGLKYAGHAQAEMLAAARIAAFRGMVERANAAGCGLFVLTGDLFENTYGIAKRDIKAVLELLSGFCGTVAVLPGNHDFYSGDARVWQQFAELQQEYDNILLLCEYRPYPLMVDGEKVVLYPALCTSLHSLPGQNNLGWIRDAHPEADAVYRIGIAHGALEGETIDNEGRYFSMTRAELEAIPVDVWLLGHTHVPFPRDLREDAAYTGERIFNPGTHVQTDVNCNTEGCCMYIEIEGGTGQKAVRAKKVVSGNLRFFRLHIAIPAGASLRETVDRALAALPDRAVVDLVLSGAVDAAEYAARAKILEEALTRFVEGTYHDAALSKRITGELIAAEFPETSFSAGLLTALLEEPKEAQLAYELLQSLKEGAR